MGQLLGLCPPLPCRPCAVQPAALTRAALQVTFEDKLSGTKHANRAALARLLPVLANGNHPV